MPIVLPKHMVAHRHMLRDVRPASVRMYAAATQNEVVASVAFGLSVLMIFATFIPVWIQANLDLITLVAYFYFRKSLKKDFVLPFKLPRYANRADSHNHPPGKTSGGKAEGILFLGNVSDTDDDDFGRELWLTNNDARTHILYLGTTGSGKTEGLKSMVSNTLGWGSGFVYVDGKADTDLWASLYSLARRFGRDDDILALNYMTGNSDDGSTSNTMNPFSNGSASYLANLVINLMPDAGGDNAMWKERAVALMFALMPALTFKRDKQGMLLDVNVVRNHLELAPIIKISRDQNVPERIRTGIEGYLNTLPGFVGAAFDDDGNERPASPDQPMYDLQVARQQHGYLSMQFTRSMQSLADEYGYIFKAQLADIDVLDVVLNRRIMVVLIPALEKSGDEAANLGKIVASCLKGMMGATLGNTVEGSWEGAIGSKQTRSNSSFMTVFDEVGYYTAPGMAVMAAQARSLGFSLVFASQDLPSMEKRVKAEAKSIVGNCNLKILGRIEDPTDTKDFVQKHGGGAMVMETRGFTASSNSVGSMFMNMPFADDRGASLQTRNRIDYDHLRGQREGEAHLIFGDWACKAQMFYAVPDRAKALRVHRLLAMPGVNEKTEIRDRVMLELASRLKDKDWAATGAAAAARPLPEIAALQKTIAAAQAGKLPLIQAGAAAIASVAALPPGKPVAEDGLDVTGTTATSFGTARSDQSTARAGITPEQRAATRAGLPPLGDGDEFAIEELDRSYAAVSSGGAGTGAPDMSEHIYDAQPRTGFGASETDFEVLPVEDEDEDYPDPLSESLPEELLAILARSADRLNNGLRREKVDS